MVLFLILDLCGIIFHAVMVFGLAKDNSFKYVIGHCTVSGFPSHLTRINFYSVSNYLIQVDIAVCVSLYGKKLHSYLLTGRPGAI